MQNRGVSQSRAELKIKLHDEKLFERSLTNALMRVLEGLRTKHSNSTQVRECLTVATESPGVDFDVGAN